tara:strand:- start:420 stop:665 length:246 start_codon:yes stop_codon:yes gene_type:complete
MKFLKIEHIDKKYSHGVTTIKTWPAIINIEHIISIVPIEDEKESEHVQIGMIHNPYRQTTFVVNMSIEQFYVHLNRNLISV